MHCRSACLLHHGNQHVSVTSLNCTSCSLLPVHGVVGLFVQLGGAAQMEAALANAANLQNTSLETFNASQAEANLLQVSDQNCQPPSTTFAPIPPSPPPSSSPSPLSTTCLDEFSSCGANILSQKLRNLELQTGQTEAAELRRSILDPSCLLTPPNSPLTLDRTDALKADHDTWMQTDGETLPWLHDHDEGIERSLISVFCLF